MEIQVELSIPIKISDKTISSLVLKEPTVADLIEADKFSGIEYTATLVARCAGLTSFEVKAMSASDFRKVDKAMLPFLSDGAAS
jgi:hypothetical protein